MFKNVYPISFNKIINIENWESRICSDEIIGFIEISKSNAIFEKRDDYIGVLSGKPIKPVIRNFQQTYKLLFTVL